MAEAEKCAIEKVVTTTEDGVTLKLNMAETRAVYAALLRVAGSPKESPRGLIDGVRDAIDAALGHSGTNWVAYDPEWACFQTGTGIVAEDYDSTIVRTRLNSPDRERLYS